MTAVQLTIRDEAANLLVLARGANYTVLAAELLPRLLGPAPPDHLCPIHFKCPFPCWICARNTRRSVTKSYLP